MSLVGLTPSAPKGSGVSSHVMDSDQSRFMQDVIEASATQPILVDFWAPWCGPCRTLTPLLEKTVAAYNGKVKLVKINIDQNQALAGQLRVQSVPTVFGFVGGQPVDAFTGAQPESQIKAFIDRLMAAAGNPAAPNEAAVDAIIDQAQALLKAGKAGEAIAVGQQLFEALPDQPKIAALLATLYLSAGEADKAQDFLASLSDSLKASAEIKALEGTLKLAAEAANEADPQTLRTKLDADPGDHDTALRLATAYAGRGLKQEAIDVLLASIAQDKSWKEGVARQKLLTLFEAFGAQDPATLAGRKALSALLFS